MDVLKRTNWNCAYCGELVPDNARLNTRGQVYCCSRHRMLHRSGVFNEPGPVSAAMVWGILAVSIVATIGLLVSLFKVLAELWRIWT